MTARKILLWVLPVFIIAALIIPNIIERTYQTDRRAGWITHLAPSESATGGFASCGSDGDIFVDGQGSVWVTGTGPCDTTYEIYVYNGESWTNMGSRLNVGLALDGTGRMWKLAEVKGSQNRTSVIEISVYEGDHWTRWATAYPNRIHQDFNSSDTFTFDGQGRVWVGFNRRSETGYNKPGVSVFNGQKWTTYTPENSGLIGNAMVAAIAFDPQDRAWISTLRGGLSVFDGQAWTNYRGEDFGLPNTTDITTIAFDWDGDAWLGTVNGDVIAQEGDQWIVHNIDNCSMYPCNPDIAFDQHGGTWVATGKAANVFDGESWTTLTPQNSGLAGGGISAVSVDEEGHIWFGCACNRVRSNRRIDRRTY